MNVLGLKNTESGEPQLKDIGKKDQDKNEFIFHNNLSDSIWNKITDIIKRLISPIIGHLENVTWIHLKTIPLLEVNNSTAPIQKGVRGSGCCAYEDVNIPTIPVMWKRALLVW